PGCGRSARGWTPGWRGPGAGGRRARSTGSLRCCFRTWLPPLPEDKPGCSAGRFVRAGRYAAADCEAVPGVDADDGEGEVGEFFSREVVEHPGLHLVRPVSLGYEGLLFGTIKGGAFPASVEGGFPPGGEDVVALFGFPGA